jgi:hypothetical protein
MRSRGWRPTAAGGRQLRTVTGGLGCGVCVSNETHAGIIAFFCPDGGVQ